MDNNDAKPMTDGDITPSPASAGLKPAAPLKSQGVDTHFAHDEPVAAVPNAETIKSGAQRITGQAQDQVRSFADQGKERVTGLIDQLAEMLNDAASQVDGKLGGQYGDYARQVAGHVTGLADQLRDKDTDELVEDVRTLVRKSPGAAVGVSAAIGFVVARLVSSGLEQRDAI